MALKSTIYKADLSVADLDRNVYADFPLTLALHPSETEERLMVRLVAFALFADEQLAFGPGISTPEEPDLWQRDLTGRIERWIEIGQPDDKQIGRASGRADEVVVVAYGRGADVWWKGIEPKLTRFQKLTVLCIEADTCKALNALAARNMKLAATIQDGHVLIAGDAGSVDVAIETLKTAESVR
ncbi:MAG: YaeQ family protein [Betaproteobacteria bacterium]|nr:YaeQ family protein [Betaproteobacteria bacterium]